jgi:hypothetical protein
MNITLETYIKRTDEITNILSSSSSQEINQKNKNEMLYMISFIEQTLLYMKKKYTEQNINLEDKCLRPSKNTLIKNVKPIELFDKTKINRVDLMWSDDINQYSIKINNLILRGNIGNIYDKKIIYQKNICAHQVTPCFNGNRCSAILSQKYCKYYHDPVELIQLKNDNIISEEFYQTTIKYTRNFSNTSWIYTNINSNNRNMKYIGSKSNLDNDISILKLSKDRKKIIENMKQLVFHDLLVLLILNENGLA